MKREADVKRRVKQLLDERNIWWMMHVPMGMGVQGIPDFLCCVHGKFVAIETKFGGGKLTAWQERQLDLIEKAGGAVLVVTERNLPYFENWLDNLILRYQKK